MDKQNNNNTSIEWREIKQNTSVIFGLIPDLSIHLILKVLIPMWAGTAAWYVSFLSSTYLILGIKITILISAFFAMTPMTKQIYFMMHNEDNERLEYVAFYWFYMIGGLIVLFLTFYYGYLALPLYVLIPLNISRSVVFYMIKLIKYLNIYFSNN